jgi:hypothetical protein
VELTDPEAPQLTLGVHGAPVQALVACGGTVFSAGCDGRVLAWRPGGAFASVVGTHRAGVTCAEVAPAGHLVAAGHDGYVLAWTGPVPETLAVHPGGVERLCLLASGAVVTAGRDGRLLFHGPSARATPVELHQRRRELTAALMPVPIPDSTDALLTATGHRGTIRLWTGPAADPCPDELGIHGGWVLAVVALGQGRLASVGGDHVTVWDLTSGVSRPPARIPLAHGVHATAGVLLGSGDLAVTTPDGRVEVVGPQRWAV